MDWKLVLNIVHLILGMGLLVKGADFFVDGASNIARALKIPSLIIGLTLVSMGTSAPEASVSINGAINGLNDISLGNVVGSNIVNTALILGVSALIIPVIVDKDMRKFDIPLMLFFYVAVILCSFVITPYVIDRIEGGALLLFFIGYMVFLILRAKRSAKTLDKTPDEQNVQTETLETDSPDETDGKKKKKIKKKQPIWLSIIFAVLGLAGIIFGGDLVVDNAAVIATKLGMSEALVGLTIVAVGTSLPELVTSVVAAIKKEADIAVGNVIGSNIFNVIFILGISSVISPLAVMQGALVDMLVMLGSGVIIMVVALFSKKINRWQGALLTLAYIGYLTYIIIRN